jgi:hypothetical protein
MLLEQLATQGWSTFDLTPGADYWKSQFATAQEEVHVLSVFQSAAALRMDELRGQAVQRAKRVVARGLGVRYSGLVSRALDELRRLKPFRIAHWIAARLVCGFWSNRETRVYRATRAPSETVGGASVNRDRIADFLLFEPDDFANDRRQVFSSLLRVVEREGHTYSRVEADRLLAFGLCGTSAGGVLPDDILPPQGFPEGAVVCQAATARGATRGPLLKALLARMAADALKTPGVTSAWVCVPATDLGLRNVVEELGFTHESSCFLRSRLYRKTRWQTTDRVPADTIETR